MAIARRRLISRVVSLDIANVYPALLAEIALVNALFIVQEQLMEPVLAMIRLVSSASVERDIVGSAATSSFATTIVPEMAPA